MVCISPAASPRLNARAMGSRPHFGGGGGAIRRSGSSSTQRDEGPCVRMMVRSPHGGASCPMRVWKQARGDERSRGERARRHGCQGRRGRGAGAFTTSIAPHLAEGRSPSHRGSLRGLRVRRGRQASPRALSHVWPCGMDSGTFGQAERPALTRVAASSSARRRLFASSCWARSASNAPTTQPARS